MESNIKYEKTYLNEVLFKIEFPHILKLYTTDKDAAEEFQNIVYKEFPEPIFNTNKTINFQVDPLTGLPISKEDSEHLIWQFCNDEKGKKLKLSADSLSLIYEGNFYSGFEDFKKDVNLALKGLEKYPISEIKFLGLRYINQIKIDNYDKIDDFINSNIHLVNNSFVNENLIQSLSRVELKFNDYILAFQFGQFNPEYPSVYSQKDFILDYDCYLNIKEDFENIISNLEEMHSIICDKFEDSIENGLRDMMGVKE